MTNLGFDSDYVLDMQLTPAGPEFVLLSPWGTVIKKWTEEPPLYVARRYAALWRASHPEHERPETPQEVKLSALDRLRNRLASALWVR